MKVKNIITRALRYINRADVIPAVENGTLSGEPKTVVDTLIYCFNAVEDELSRYYLPLVTQQTFSLTTHRLPYTAFEYTPVKILKVTLNGKEAGYSVEPKQLYIDFSETQYTNNTVSVKYGYAPSSKDIGGDSAYGDECGEKLIAYGISAEYMLLNGEMQLSSAWEERYRKEIETVQKSFPSAKHVPPRRWV